MEFSWTGIPEERDALYADNVLLSSLQKVAVPTLHPQLTSVFLSEIIKQFVYLVSKFLVSDMRCRNKASVELCILENKLNPAMSSWACLNCWEGWFPKSLLIINLFHNIIDLCRRVILHTKCLTFFTSPVPPALGHILSIRAWYDTYF